MARSAAGFIDSEGTILPSLVSLTIRGREILAENNVDNVNICLGPVSADLEVKLDIVNWFLAQVSMDITACGHDVADAPASSSYGEKQESSKLSDQKEEIVNKHMDRLRNHSSRKSVSFDKSL